MSNLIVGVVSRQGPEQDPLLKRCLDSLRSVDAGLPFELKVEVGERLSKGEKRERLFANARDRGIRYACILESDTEIVSPGWLAALALTTLAVDQPGILNPLETKDGVTIVGQDWVRGRVGELTNAFGFCMFFDLAWGPSHDPRITWLDDLCLSLKCRAAGRRIILSGHTMVRHSKAPYLSDDLPPWQQNDRSRWGEGSVYYSQERFQAERLAEAGLLIAEYGKMAVESLPSDLIEGLVQQGMAGSEHLEAK